MVEPKILAGFLDFLPEKAKNKDRMIEICKETLQSFSFSPIETPHIEYAEMLVPNADQENKKMIYQFQDQGKRHVALRFDHTVPLARFVSLHQHELSFPFKRYVVGNVFRGESPQSGRYREFTQFDFDIVGTQSIFSDLEILLVVIRTLEKLGLEQFQIFLNHRLFFNALCQNLGLEQNVGEVLTIVDKYDKIGAGKVLDELASLMSVDKAEQILAFLGQATGSGMQDFISLRTYIQKNFSQPELFAKPLQDTQTIFQALHALGKNDRVQLNLKIARGLDYYTGLVFETFIEGARNLGSICSGGRYDNLMQNFSSTPLPSIGGSIGLDRLLFYREKNNLSFGGNKKIYIAALDQESYIFALKVSEALRQQAIEVFLNTEGDKLKKHFSTASKLAMDYLLVVGKTEQETGLFTLADLASGEKHSGLTQEKLIAALQL